MLFHLFIFFSHMNWPIPSYSAGKLTIRMIHVHIVTQCHSQGNMQELVGNSVTFRPCRQTLSPFNLPRQSLASIVILQIFISIKSVTSLHKNVVSLVYLLFPHELAYSLLLSWLVDYQNDTCTHCHTISLIAKHARITKKLCHIPYMQVDTFSVQFHNTVVGQYCHIVDLHQYNFCDEVA